MYMYVYNCIYIYMSLFKRKVPQTLMVNDHFPIKITLFNSYIHILGIMWVYSMFKQTHMYIKKVGILVLELRALEPSRGATSHALQAGLDLGSKLLMGRCERIIWNKMGIHSIHSPRKKMMSLVNAT